MARRQLLACALQASAATLGRRATSSVAAATLALVAGNQQQAVVALAGSRIQHAWGNALPCHHGAQQRGMACSAGLGRAPPKVINIEYDPEDVETYIQVADAIEEAFPTVLVRGNEDKDGRPGSFEVDTEEGVTIFSRLQAHQLPGAQDILRRIAQTMVVPKPDAEHKPFCA